MWSQQKTLSRTDSFPDIARDLEDFNLLGTSGANETSMTSSEILECLDSAPLLDTVPWNTLSDLNSLSEGQQRGANTPAASLNNNALNSGAVEENIAGARGPTVKREEKPDPLSDEYILSLVESMAAEFSTEATHVNTGTTPEVKEVVNPIDSIAKTGQSQGISRNCVPLPPFRNAFNRPEFQIPLDSSTTSNSFPSGKNLFSGLLSKPEEKHNGTTYPAAADDVVLSDAALNPSAHFQVNTLGEQVLPTQGGGPNVGGPNVGGPNVGGPTVPTKDEFFLSLTQTMSAVSSTIHSKPLEDVNDWVSLLTLTRMSAPLTATQTEANEIVPPLEFQNRVTALFNNLDRVDLIFECRMIRFYLRTAYFTWMARHMLNNYITQDQQLHAIFSNFLDVLEEPTFNEALIKETIRSIKEMLTGAWIKTDSVEGTMLKNLGHWLGSITIAKNRPILEVEMDLNDLVNAADIVGEGVVLRVIPFVAKVLEPCAQSEIFRPPNPWTMSMLNAINRLREKYRLSFNLHFEIALLLHKLGLKSE